MRNYAILTVSVFLLSIASMMAQAVQDPVQPAVSVSPSDGICPPADCLCEGGMVELNLYYFGAEPATITAYANQALTVVIDSWAGVTDGQELLLDGSGLVNGKLPFNTYFEVTSGGETCVTKIFTTCPISAWPGATKDLAILGKKFGNFIISGYTDLAGNPSCTIADTEQDWHVGGNIVDASENTLGTLNDEDLILISNNTPRGVLTSTGDLGINTLSPVATLDVDGDGHLSGDVDVDGNANVDMNLTVGVDATVGGNAQVDGNANVDMDLTVGNDASVGGNAQVDGNANVDIDLTVGNNATVGGNARVGGDGTVTGTLGVGTLLPQRKMHVVGDGIRLSSSATRYLDFRTDGTGLDINSIGDDLFVRSPAGNAIFMNTQPGDGKVGIGTTSLPNTVGADDISFYNLYVSGGILTEELRVRTGWADFVFLPEYRLPQLSEVNQEIQQIGHLPGMPSTAEVEANGLEVGDMIVRQQVKIEEIYLYLIEMDEEVRKLREENAELRQTIEELRQ